MPDATTGTIGFTATATKGTFTTTIISGSIIGFYKLISPPANSSIIVTALADGLTLSASGYPSNITGTLGTIAKGATSVYVTLVASTGYLFAGSSSTTSISVSINQDAYKSVVAQHDIDAARATATNFINGLIYPFPNPTHKPSLLGAIGASKAAALLAISKAQTVTSISSLASSATTGSELIKVQRAINNYNNSHISAIPSIPIN